MVLPRRPRGIVSRLVLGPIVGHTDQQSSRVWIQVADDPENYKLRVHGVGLFGFVSTEGPGPLEFRTAIAKVAGLRSDTIYRYAVVRLGRTIVNGRGSFRTFPAPGSMAHLTFCVVSCNQDDKEGRWPALAKYIAEAKPQFLLMMGDQVYLDSKSDNLPDLFSCENRHKPRPERRVAIAEKYRVNWSRDIVRDVLANIPVYMMWDDHDIRDGWGSSPADSPTMVDLYPRGRPIYELCRGYFEDCRDAYWHFQACHNPRPSDGFVDALMPNYADAPVQPGERKAMPFAFRCGRLAVLVLDSRGDRDVFRKVRPILGKEQWDFINTVFRNLASDVEALAVVTATPLTSMDPEGPTLELMGDRIDDIEAFKIGNEKGALDLPSDDGPGDALMSILNHHVSAIASPVTGRGLNLDTFKLSNIDEARDQWSHKYSRPEQVELLRATGAALPIRSMPSARRTPIFLAGDIHVGARYQVTCTYPRYEALSLIASGINVVHDSPPTMDVIMSREFDVAPGIHSKLLELSIKPNFGVVDVVPTGSGAKVSGALSYEGVSIAFGADISNWL